MKRRVEALRRPLELAAADGFLGVRKVVGLGNALRIACDGLIAKLPSDALASWRRTLGRWEQLDEQQQAIEVARGMRLIARMPRASATVAAVEPATSGSASGAPPAPAPAPGEAGDPLAAPTHTLPGIGPALAERLAERELITVEDLLWCLPRRYDDVRGARPLAEVCRLAEGQRATFVASVATSRMVFARGRRWGEVRLVAQGAPSGGAGASATVRWFNIFAGIDKRMPPGAQVVLSGIVRRRGGRTEFANPDILGIEAPAGAEPATAGARPLPAILARYPDVPGVPAGRLRAACAAACARVGAAVDDGVPAAVERAAGLPSLAEALSR